MKNISKLIAHKLEKYTASGAFQAILPANEEILQFGRIEHQFQLQQVDGETKIGHKFPENTPEWGRKLLLRMYRLVKKYGDSYPRDWCQAWLEWKFSFRIKLRDNLVFNTVVHPWFVLGLLEKETFDGLHSQIEQYCKVQQRKHKNPNFAQPLEFYEQMSTLRAQKSTKIFTEEGEKEKPVESPPQDTEEVRITVITHLTRYGKTLCKAEVPKEETMTVTKFKVAPSDDVCPDCIHKYFEDTRNG